MGESRRPFMPSQLQQQKEVVDDCPAGHRDVHDAAVFVYPCPGHQKLQCRVRHHRRHPGCYACVYIPLGVCIGAALPGAPVRDLRAGRGALLLQRLLLRLVHRRRPCAEPRLPDCVPLPHGGWRQRPLDSGGRGHCRCFPSRETRACHFHLDNWADDGKCMLTTRPVVACS